MLYSLALICKVSYLLPFCPLASAQLLDRTLHSITVQLACVPLQQQVLVAAVVTD